METKQTLKQKIISISNEINLKNDKKLPQGSNCSYEYFSLPLLVNTLKPLLQKYDVFYHFNISKENAESSMNIATLTISHASGDDAETVVHNMYMQDIIINDNYVQGAGGLRTYGKRYLLMDAFHIADDSTDIEGREVTHYNKQNLQIEKIETEVIKKITELLKTAGYTETDFFEKTGLELQNLQTKDLTKARKFYLELKKKLESK